MTAVHSNCSLGWAGHRVVLNAGTVRALGLLVKRSGDRVGALSALAAPKSCSPNESGPPNVGKNLGRS